MSGIRIVAVIVSAVFLLSACKSVKTASEELMMRLPIERGPSEQKFINGIKSYEAGDYTTSQNELQTALSMGLGSSEQVVAHKYLAFINCVSGREKQCRDEFKKVLEIDPVFELKPAEEGHPIWGPVFRSVKGKAGK